MSKGAVVQVYLPFPVKDKRHTRNGYAFYLGKGVQIRCTLSF